MPYYTIEIEASIVFNIDAESEDQAKAKAQRIVEAMGEGATVLPMQPGENALHPDMAEMQDGRCYPVADGHFEIINEAELE